MSLRPTRWGAVKLTGAATVALFFAISVGGCGSEAGGEDDTPQLPDATGSAYSDPATERATERGLLAAVLANLDSDAVASAGYAEPSDAADLPPGVPAGLGYVSVTLKDGTTVGVSVAGIQTGQPSPTCSTEQFYEAISCFTDPFLFLGEAGRNFTDGMPRYEARTRSDTRGDVLIQLWTDSPRTEALTLLEPLIDDPYLGIQTTAGLNALGEELKNLDVLTIEAEAEIVQ